MQEFKKGQRVKVEFEGEVQSLNGYDQTAKIRDACNWHHYVYLKSPHIKVTVLDPADWPPQVGDIWEADGREYYAQKSMSRGILLRAEDTSLPSYEMESIKAANPVLVRRRGQ